MLRVTQRQVFLFFDRSKTLIGLRHLLPAAMGRRISFAEIY